MSTSERLKHIMHGQSTGLSSIVLYCIYQQPYTHVCPTYLQTHPATTNFCIILTVIYSKCKTRPLFFIFMKHFTYIKSRSKATSNEQNTATYNRIVDLLLERWKSRYTIQQTHSNRQCAPNPYRIIIKWHANPTGMRHNK